MVLIIKKGVLRTRLWLQTSAPNWNTFLRNKETAATISTEATVLRASAFQHLGLASLLVNSLELSTCQVDPTHSDKTVSSHITVWTDQSL